MLRTPMEPDVIRGLGPQADRRSQMKAMAYFEHVKSTDQGIQVSATALANETYSDDNVNFFMWKILEHQVSYRYYELSDNLKNGIRSAIMTWLQNFSKKSQVTDAPFVRNKAAQVFSLLFVKEYLTSWTNFPQDILKIVSGPDVVASSSQSNGIDMYLRILESIDVEVVDRHFDKTPEFQSRCQCIKDTMRDQCVNDLVESWYYILVSPNTNQPCLILCLKIIGRYITWIDVNLIVNDRFMVLIFNFLKSDHSSEVREAACVCITGIVSKGMSPQHKLSLFANLWPALEDCSIFQLASVSDEEHIELIIKLSRMVSTMLSSIIVSHTKAEKGSQIQTHILESARAKMPVLLRFFINDDDDVSLQCVDAIKDFIDLEKKVKKNTDETNELLKQILFAIISKMKYDLEYNFDNDGEDEAEFDDFLKSLKTLFENLAILSPDLVMTSIAEMMTETLKQWKNLPFNEVEVIIRVMYLLGESLSTNFSQLFSSDNLAGSTMREMMRQLVLSEVVSHGHMSVRKQYFETIVRYDRYFPIACNSLDEAQRVSLIVNTIQAFLDHRGLRSDNMKLRSRCSYLFSRFVKTLGKVLNPFAEEILDQVSQLLVLPTAQNHQMERLLSAGDQMFMYELCGYVVVNANLDQTRTIQLVTAILQPLVQDFDATLRQLVAHAETEATDNNKSQQQQAKNNNDGEEQQPPPASMVYANTLNFAMGYASRTSKAFTSKQTMRNCGCAQVYIDALNVFLSVLTVHHHSDILHLGFRQYMHRMVTCVEDEVLHFIPIIVRNLVSNQSANALLEFIPFFNQIISKFKKVIGPFIHEIFMVVVRAVFQVLNQQQNNNCNGGYHEDDAILKTRSHYFNFLHSLVNNNLAGVMIQQNKDDFEQVLTTLVQGATDFRDAITRKVVFSIMLKMVETWDSDEDTLWNICREKFLPVCFHAPLNNNFDLQDAQTVLVLNESCNLMRSILSKHGDKVEIFLRDFCLPNLNLTKDQTQEYCLALRHPDAKVFKNYSKNFFSKMKTS